MTDTYTPVLTQHEKAKFVSEIVELGDSFVSPLFAVVEAIERAAIEAYQRLTWRDPATAPKDSSFVLVSAFGEVWMGAFHNGGWIISNPRSTMGDVDIDGWQPLPPPPETI